MKKSEEPRTSYMDYKGFVNINSSSFESIEKSFDNKTLVELGWLLEGMKNDKIKGEDKKNLCIIQFGFVLTNKKNEVLVINRLDGSHKQITGTSIIQSTSPHRKPEGGGIFLFVGLYKSILRKRDHMR